MSQISNFFQNPIANFQALSLKSKTMIGLVAMLVAYLLVVLVTPSPFQKPTSQVANTPSSSTSNSQLATNPNTSSLVNFDNANSNIPLGYPQNLKKNKSNPKVIANEMQIKSEGNQKLFSQYNRNSKEIIKGGITAQDSFVSDPVNKRIYNYQLTDKPSLVNKGIYYELSNYSKPEYEFDIRHPKEPIIFWATPDDLQGIPEISKIDPTKTDNTFKPEKNRGLTIYTKPNKDGTGSTWLHDYEKNNEFKLADQNCKWITFSSSEFFCLNTKYQLINLTTNQTVAENIVDVTEDDDNNLFMVSLKGEIFKANLSSVKVQKSIYKTKTGENITKLTYTNQKELLLHIVFDGGSEVFQAKKLEREKAQAAAGYNSVKTTDKVINEMTTELLPDGSIKDRPEFKEYIVML
jgi:hypothetical protein